MNISCSQQLDQHAVSSMFARMRCTSFPIVTRKKEVLYGYTNSNEAHILFLLPMIKGLESCSLSHKRVIVICDMKMLRGCDLAMFSQEKIQEER